MKKLKRRNRKHKQRAAIKLRVESLEPRLVLSAVGLGFNDGLDRPDLEDRERLARGKFRTELTSESHSSRGNERLGRHQERSELANRLDHDRKSERDDAFDRHTRSHHRFEDRPAFEDRHGEPLNNVGEGEEANSFYYDFDAEEFNSRNDPVTLFEPSATLRPVVLVTLAPPQTSGLPPLGQLSATPNQSLLATTIQSFTDSSNSAPTLPITVPTSSSTASQTATSTTPADQSFASLEFDSDRSDNSLQDVSPTSAAVADSRSEYFVTLKTTADDSIFGLDGAVDSGLSTAFHTSETAIATDAMNDSFMNQVFSFSDDSLWMSLSEGGFIEIDDNAGDKARIRFDIDLDSDDEAVESDDQADTDHNAFWFDFDDTRFDLLMDVTQFEELAAEIDSLDEANSKANDAWLLDEGGMIVLTTRQGDSEASQLAQQQNSIESTTNNDSNEVNVQMNADIGIFQAIEVASSPIDLLETALHDKEVKDEPSRAVASDDDNLTPPAEQAAVDAGRTSDEPTRAAALPWIATLVALLDLRRRKQKPAENSQIHV